MEETRNDIDALIGKHLAGETTLEESMVVEQWVQSDEANRKYFDHIKTIFERTASMRDTLRFDEDAAWEKLKARLAGKQAKTIVLPKRQSSFITWRIAASILIVLGIGFFTYQLTTAQQNTVEVATHKETVTDTLPDGSAVFLNKQTHLTYNHDRKKKNHHVKLEGEAYFNIHHDDSKSFVIETDGVYIRDIGTSFNVKAYPDSETIEVVVQEGAVMFYTANDSGVYLRASGKGIYNKTSKKFSIAQPELNVLAYKTKNFVFSNSDLRTVTDELNKVYDKKIVIGSHLASCHLTVTFNNESIEEIASIIAETLGLTLTVSDQQFTLEGAGCENL